MPPADPTPAQEPARADPRARKLTAAAAWVCLAVLVAGANVTSTKSGDAIPTWPWGWAGKDVAGWIELSHRYVAGLLIATTAAAAILTGSSALRRISWWVFGLVIVQAALGGVRVLVGAADESHGALPWLKVAHAFLGQSIYPLAVAAACVASDWWAVTKERPLEDSGLALLRASGLALLVLMIQLLLGALGRHGIIAREVHAVFALPALLLVARVVLISSGDLPRDVELLRGPAAALGFLAAVQLALGVAAYVVTIQREDPLKREFADVAILNAHLGVGAAMLGLLVSVILRTVRLWGVPTDERVAAALKSREASP